MAISILNGKEIFVTSGGTRAYIDAIRFIGNKSSGRLGAYIAAEFLKRGAYVSYFHGEGAVKPTDLYLAGDVQLDEEAVDRLDLIEIETIPQLASAIERELKDDYYDATIHAMAVLDFVPDLTSVLAGKTKSDEKEEWDIKLVRTPKIINMIKKISPDTMLIGFKLEVGMEKEKLLESARHLMEQCGADIVVANDLQKVKPDEYKASVIDSLDDRVTYDIEGRQALADLLCDRVEARLRKSTIAFDREQSEISE